MNKKNNKGFSLVELIVVVAIMAVLVGILAPAYLKYVEKSRIQKDDSAIAEVVEAAKIAASEEKCYDALTTAADTGIVVGTGAKTGWTATDADELNKAVKTTVSSFEFSSKAWKNSTSGPTITAKSSDSGVTVEVTGAPEGSTYYVAPKKD